MDIGNQADGDQVVLVDDRCEIALHIAPKGHDGVFVGNGEDRLGTLSKHSRIHGAGVDELEHGLHLNEMIEVRGSINISTSNPPTYVFSFEVLDVDDTIPRLMSQIHREHRTKDGRMLREDASVRHDSLASNLQHKGDEEMTAVIEDNGSEP